MIYGSNPVKHRSRDHRIDVSAAPTTLSDANLRCQELEALRPRRPGKRRIVMVVPAREPASLGTSHEAAPPHNG